MTGLERHDDDEIIETIWASKKRRVQARAKAMKLQNMKIEAEMREIKEKLTLRDHFAGLAPITFRDAYFLIQSELEEKKCYSDVIKLLVELRFEYADAMLKARETKAE